MGSTTGSVLGVSYDNVETPPYSVIERNLFDDHINFTVMSHGMCLSIDAYDEQLRDPFLTSASDHLLAEFTRFRQDANYGGLLIHEFEKWAIKPCLPLLRQFCLAAEYTQPQLTLYHFCFPPVFQVSLQNWKGCLRAYLGQASSINRLCLDPVSLSELEANGLCTAETRLFLSNELRIVPGYDLKKYETCAIPDAVLLPSSHGSSVGRKVGFKTIMSEQSLKRDLEVYIMLAGKTAESNIRIPQLIGLVKDHDEQQGDVIIGYLIEYIENQYSLKDAPRSASRAARRRWMRQVDCSVRFLHSCGVACGEIRPEDVLIDFKEDAWLMDFKDGYFPDWVAPTDDDTVRDDLEALEELRQFLEAKPNENSANDNL